MDRRTFTRAGLAAAAGATTRPLLPSAAAAPGHGGRSETLTEPERGIPVVGTTQVAVVGGGIAGVAAAIAAARLGAKVALIEKQTLPGGLATLGNVVIYLPLCDGRGNKVSGGICEELLRVSVRHRPNTIPGPWQGEAAPQDRAKTRYRVEFNPWDFALDMEQLLLREGVDIWYDTLFCDVHREGDSVAGLFLENKSGRIALRADMVVDASGDADVMARAGADTDVLDSNVRAGWFFAWDGKRVRRIVLSARFTEDGSRVRNDPHAFDGTDGRQVTAQLIESRRMQRDRLARMRKENPAAEPVNLNTIPDFRMTRRLVGERTLKESDMGTWPKDTVGLFANWRRKGPVYPVPFGSLYSDEVANVLAAGRCISSAETAWDQARAIPACAVSGEAAGTAAAMAVRGGIRHVAALPVDQLQAALRRAGGILDPALCTQARQTQGVPDRTADPKAH